MSLPDKHILGTGAGAAESSPFLKKLQGWVDDAKKQPTLYFGGTSITVFCILSLLVSMGIQQTQKLDSRIGHLDEWVDDEDDDVALHHFHPQHLEPGCKHPAVTQGATIAWATAPMESDRKYLLLDCWIGQISNRKQCILNHMVVAGILNRTLVVPHALNTFMDDNEEYDLRVIWDMETTNQCVGEHAAVWLDEFFDHQGQHFDHELRSFKPEEMNLPSHHGNPHMPIDHIQCLHGPEKHCSSGDAGPRIAVGCPLTKEGSELQIDEKELAKGFPGVKLNISGTTGDSSCLGAEPSIKQIMEAFTSDQSSPQFTAKVLVIGDIEAYVFNDPDWGLVKPANVNPNYYIPLGGIDPFKRLPACPPTHKGLLLPPLSILKRAKTVALSLFGDAPSPTGQGKVIAPFVSFHWRRGEFLNDDCGEVPGQNSKWCLKKAEEVAKCVNAVMSRNNISSLFLATNAPEDEASAFYSAMKSLHGENLVLRQYLEEDWAWLRDGDLPGVDLNTQEHTIQATLDKAVAAMATYFVGSDVSKFSMDIYRMRVGLGRDNTCDTIISHCDV